MSDIPQMTYLENLDHRLDQLGFNIHQVPGDGNCLFSAFGIQVQRNPLELRHKAVAFINDNPSLYRKHTGDDSSLKEYCARMIKDKEYGDLLVINALSEVLKRPVMVICPYGDPQHFGFQKFSLSAIVILAYNGTNHYDAVTPQREDPDLSLARALCRTDTSMDFPVLLPRIVIQDLVPDMCQRLKFLEEKNWIARFFHLKEINGLKEMIKSSLEGLDFSIET